MKFTIFRRIVQFIILSLFICGNIYGIKILQGNLSSSLFLEKIHLSDPYATLQLFLSGFFIDMTALSGAIIVFVFYALIAPRAFCSFVCPVNILTDLAAFLRKKLNITKNFIVLKPNFRYYILFFTLLFSFIFKLPAFESLNFISLLTRSIVFISFDIISISLLILVFDMFISKRGICSHICPLGAFWAISSKFSLIRVMHNKANCTLCGKCKIVCPEDRVLNIIGKKSGPINSECISCGRCVEVCDDNALEFNILKLGEKK